MHDLLAIKAHIFDKWSSYLSFTSENLLALTRRYKMNHDSLTKERLSTNVFSHQICAEDWKKSYYEDSGREQLKQAEVDKKKDAKDEELWKESFLIEREGFFVKDSKKIKIFEEIYDVRSPYRQDFRSKQSFSTVHTYR